MYYLPPETAERIRVSILAGATFDNVQDYINFFGDRVIITGGEITATLPADGTVAVAPCTAWCKETDSDTAVGVFLDFAGIGNIALTDLTVNVLYLDYNAGTPQVVVATSYLTYGFQQDHILLGAVYRNGNVTHIVNSDRLGIQGINRTHLQLVEHGPHRTSGMVTLAAGVRNLAITAGLLHLGLIRIITPARDTTPAGGDTFTYWYYDGSLLPPAWVQVLGETQISNTQYNDVAAGLVAFTPNRYGVHWVFMDFDGHLHVVYGQGDYTAAQAEGADIPAPLPNIILMFSVIVCKIICQEGTNVLTITYPWTIPFTSALANDHSLLANLAADDHLQYLNIARHDLPARHPLAVLDPLVCSEAEAAFLVALHAALTAAGIHGSSVAAAINTLIHRDAAGRAQIVDPAVAADIDNMGARNAAIAAIVLGDLADVVDTAAVEGDMLYFDQVSGTWMVGARANLAELFGNLMLLDDLADVTAPAPVDGDFLSWSLGLGVWQNRQLAEIDMPAGMATDAEVATAVSDHAALVTGIHGVGSYGFGSMTLAAVTLYVDAGAGNDGNPGTSASPKATIKGALDALPILIAHACTICVRGPQNYPENNVRLEFSRFSTLAGIVIKSVNSSDEDMYDHGLATGGGNNFLDDAGAGWSVDQFNGAYIWIYGGTGKGQIRTISDTTATRITVSVNWAINPDNTSYYVIGGGATLTGTDSYHLQNAKRNVQLYGFKHTGAATYDVSCSGFGTLREENGYHATSSTGTQITSQAYGWIYYNYFSSTVKGVYVVGLCLAYVRANVIDNAAEGVRAQRGAVVAMHNAVVNRNYIANCTKGIWVYEGSAVPDASSQNFGAGADANGIDIDPAISAAVPNWYT